MSVNKGKNHNKFAKMSLPISAIYSTTDTTNAWFFFINKFHFFLYCLHFNFSLCISKIRLILGGDVVAVAVVALLTFISGGALHEIALKSNVKCVM